LAQLGIADKPIGANKIDLIATHFALGLAADLIADEKIPDRTLQQRRQLKEAARRDPDLALFIFLNDLKAHTELFADIRLGQSGELACKAKLPTDMDIDRVGPMFLGRMPPPVFPGLCAIFRHEVSHSRDGPVIR